MENFELIERYVTGQLSGGEREAFEKQLEADQSLQGDLVLQQQVIEGIKKARAAELKAMLGQVPVAGLMQAGMTSGQIIAGAVTVAAVVSGTLFYFKPWEPKSQPAVTIEKEVPAKETKKEVLSTVAPVTEDKPQAASTETSKAVKKSPATITAKATKTSPPKIEVVDPTDELAQEPSTEKARTDNPQSAVVNSRIAVETVSGNQQYSFHYQFSQGKLILYGNFDKGLYEILEVNGDNHSVFLYYKDGYYLLNEKQAAITPLSLIKDQQLVSKLKAFRGQ